MKKVIYTAMIMCAVTLAVQTTQAQAWDKSTKVLGVGFGASQFFHIDKDASTYYGNFYSPLTGQLNFQGEFGVHDYVLWGFLSGVCSLIPIIGTGIIWVPLAAYFFATNNISAGIGLSIYAIVLITNVDYVARVTILKKLIDVHPLITIFGVIVGIGLFGFWGVIFGPLLFSYFIILVKIYANEFSVHTDIPDS